MNKRLVCLIAVLGLAGCGGSGEDGGDGGGTETVRTTTTRVEVVKPAQGAAGAFDPAAIYEREAPGVVTVLAVNDVEEQDGGLGSGFLLSGKGEILTNAHVVTTGEGEDIRNVEDVFVEFGDGNRVPARILGVDPDADIALIKIDPAGLDIQPLPIGSSEDVRVGEPVAAIGSPFGERQSLTTGIVSAVDRDVQSLNEQFRISGAIQTDAAINPGNSGGPLVNAKGEVLGVNQQIQTESGSSSGVGFAVPIDLAMRSVEQIRKTGEVEYAYLGVSTTPVYPQLAEHFDLPVERGAWVQSVVDGAPSDDAGVRAGRGPEQTFQGDTQLREGGDVITRLDRFPVENPTDLSTAVALLDPGQTVDMELWRDGKKRSVDVELAKRPG